MPPRPVLISAVQYQDELGSGSMDSLDVVAAAKRLGVDGVELRRDYWRDKERELPAVRDRVRELGLLVTYATTVTLFAADGGRQLRQDVDDARSLGSPQLRVFLGQAPVGDDSAAWAPAADAIAYASDRGIVLALENFARSPGCRVAEIERALARFESPSLGTNIDVGNYASNGEDLVRAVRTLGHRAVSTHLKDNDGDSTTYLGGGALPLRQVLAELDRLPQRVLHCFEFAGGGDPAGRIEKSLAFVLGG